MAVIISKRWPLAVPDFSRNNPDRVLTGVYHAAKPRTWLWDGTNVQARSAGHLRYVGRAVREFEAVAASRKIRMVTSQEMLQMCRYENLWPLGWQEHRRIFFGGTVFKFVCGSGKPLDVLWYAVYEGVWAVRTAPTDCVLRNGDMFACVPMRGAYGIPDSMTLKDLPPGRRRREYKTYPLVYVTEGCVA